MREDHLNKHIRELWAHYNAPQIAQMLGVSRHVVRWRARQMHLPHKRPGKPMGFVHVKKERAPLQGLEFAPGHFALDQRSYEILTGK